MCNDGPGEAGQPPATSQSEKCRRDAKHVVYVHIYRIGCIVIFVILTGVLPEKLAQVISASIAFYADKIVALAEVYFP